MTDLVLLPIPIHAIKKPPVWLHITEPRLLYGSRFSSTIKGKVPHLEDHTSQANQATMHLFLCSNAQKGPEGVKISHMVFISHAKKMWEKATHKGDKTVLSWYQTMRSKNVKGVFLWRVPEEKILSV